MVLYMEFQLKNARSWALEGQEANFQQFKDEMIKKGTAYGDCLVRLNHKNSLPNGLRASERIETG